MIYVVFDLSSGVELLRTEHEEVAQNEVDALNARDDFDHYAYREEQA